MFGIIAFVRPEVTLLAIVILMGIRFIATGGYQLFAATQLHDERSSTLWLFVLGGLASIALGVITFALPGPTAVVLMTILGIYAFVFGVVMLVLAFRVRPT